MGHIQSLTDLGFALRGMTAEGRVYYANLQGIDARYEDAFELAVQDLEQQADTDRTVTGFRLPVAELKRRERQYLDFIFTCLTYQQYSQRQQQQRSSVRKAA